MTRTSKLIQDLQSTLPGIEPALRDSNLTQSFETELAALAEAIAQARQVFVDPIRNQLARRNIMSKLTSHRKTLEAIYTSIKHQRQAAETATGFESFDQKANQLFNLLNTALKSQKEMQSSVTRNIL
jgi:recombinational DNA repair ATPase RecF